jgi:hypothetical protein
MEVLNFTVTIVTNRKKPFGAFVIEAFTIAL